MSKAFGAWYKSVNEERMMLTKEHRMLTRYKNNTLAVAFDSWTSHGSEEAKKRAVMARIAKLLLYHTLANLTEQRNTKLILLTMQNWTEECARFKRLESIKLKTCQLLKQQSLSKALGRWMLESDKKLRATRILTNARASRDRLALWNILDSWRDHTTVATRLQKVGKKLLGRKKGHRLFLCMSKWTARWARSKRLEEWCHTAVKKITLNALRQALDMWISGFIEAKAVRDTWRKVLSQRRKSLALWQDDIMNKVLDVWKCRVDYTRQHTWILSKMRHFMPKTALRLLKEWRAVTIGIAATLAVYKRVNAYAHRRLVRDRYAHTSFYFKLWASKAFQTRSRNRLVSIIKHRNVAIRISHLLIFSIKSWSELVSMRALWERRIAKCLCIKARFLKRNVMYHLRALAVQKARLKRKVGVLISRTNQRLRRASFSSFICIRESALCERLEMNFKTIKCAFSTWMCDLYFKKYSRHLVVFVADKRLYRRMEHFFKMWILSIKSSYQHKELAYLSANQWRLRNRGVI